MAVYEGRDLAFTEAPIRPASGTVGQFLFWRHTAAFIALNSVLFMINVLVDRSTPWFLYGVWGWGMVIALQAGMTFRWRGLLGAHVALTGTLLAGLVEINIADGGDPWVLWVLVSLAIPLLAHALYACEKETLLTAQGIAGGLWFLEILIVEFLYDNAWWRVVSTLLINGLALVALLGVHAAFRNRFPQRA